MWSLKCRLQIYAISLWQTALQFINGKNTARSCFWKNKLYLRPVFEMRHLRTYLAGFLLLLFGCYYSGISLFSHTHVVNGSSVVHSHLGGGADHDHSDSQYAVIDILSDFQSESATGFYSVGTVFFQLSESYTGYLAPSLQDEAFPVHMLRGPPQA